MIPFVPIPRCVLAAPWWREASPFRRNLFLVLMELAQWHATTAPKGERLKPGQLITSYRALAAKLAHSSGKRRFVPTVGKVRHSCNNMVSNRVISVRATGLTTGAGLLVTLEQWEFYTTGDASTTGLATGLNGAEQQGWQQPTRRIYAESKPTLEAMKDWEAKRREDAEELAELCRREGRVH
jgi:hypothetical protein